MGRKPRRQPDHKHPAKEVALVRYRPEHWKRWLETVADRKQWEETHAEWQRSADAMAGRLQRAGLKVIWVDVDPDQMARWCKSRGYENDAEARSLYAAEWIGNILPPGSSKPPG